MKRAFVLAALMASAFSGAAFAQTATITIPSASGNCPAGFTLGTDASGTSSCTHEQKSSTHKVDFTATSSGDDSSHNGTTEKDSADHSSASSGNSGSSSSDSSESHSDGGDSGGSSHDSESD